MNDKSFNSIREINAIPRHAQHVKHMEVYTEGFGYYHINIYEKGTRRYYELHGWYVGISTYSAAWVKETAAVDEWQFINTLKRIAEDRISRYRNQ